MNKIRIIGLILLIIGVILQYSFENDGTDFLTGLLGGVGIGLLITGRFKSKKKNLILRFKLFWKLNEEFIDFKTK